MDDADIAANLQQIEIDSALANRKRYVGESADNCEECGQQIPSARQLAVPGCTMCLSCASFHELRNDK